MRDELAHQRFARFSPAGKQGEVVFVKFEVCRIVEIRQLALPASAEGGLVVVHACIEPDFEHIQDGRDVHVEIGAIIHGFLDVFNPRDVFPLPIRQELADGIVFMRRIQGQHRGKVFVFIRGVQVVGQQLGSFQPGIPRDIQIRVLLLQDVCHRTQLGVVGQVAEGIPQIPLLEPRVHGQIAHVGIVGLRQIPRFIVQNFQPGAEIEGQEAEIAPDGGIRVDVEPLDVVLAEIDLRLVMQRGIRRFQPDMVIDFGPAVAVKHFIRNRFAVPVDVRRDGIPREARRAVQRVPLVVGRGERPREVHLQLPPLVDVPDIIQIHRRDIQLRLRMDIPVEKLPLPHVVDVRVVILMAGIDAVEEPRVEGILVFNVSIAQIHVLLQISERRRLRLFQKGGRTLRMQEHFALLACPFVVIPPVHAVIQRKIGVCKPRRQIQVAIQEAGGYRPGRRGGKRGAGRPVQDDIDDARALDVADARRKPLVFYPRYPARVQRRNLFLRRVYPIDAEADIRPSIDGERLGDGIHGQSRQVGFLKQVERVLRCLHVPRIGVQQDAVSLVDGRVGGNRNAFQRQRIFHQDNILDSHLPRSVDHGLLPRPVSNEVGQDVEIVVLPVIQLESPLRVRVAAVDNRIVPRHDHLGVRDGIFRGIHHPSADFLGERQERTGQKAARKE